MWLVLICSTILAYCIFNLLFSKLSYKKVLIQQRIDSIKSSDKTIETRTAKKKVKNLGFLHAPKKLKEDLSYAGIPLQAEEFVLIWMGAAFLPALLVLMFGGNILQIIILVAIGTCIPPAVIKVKKKKRIERFNQQLGNSLLAISNSLRAGFTFEQALAGVAKEMPPPISDEFSKALREIKYGGSLQTSLFAIAERMESKDFELLTSAVAVQKQVGGNLSDIIDTISTTIQDRIKIKKKIRTLSAQGRISGLVIGLLPIGLMVILTLINSEYMAGLFQSSIGKILLIFAALLEAVGFLVIHKIVKIEV